MNPRIRWLRDKLKVQNIEGMIVSNSNNIKYLTGLEAEGTLLITKKENIFITDSRYIEEVNNSLMIDDEITVSDVRGYTRDDYENFFMFCENVGFEENSLTYAEYRRVQELYKCNNLVETEKIIEKLRAVKEDDEIEIIAEYLIMTGKEITPLALQKILYYAQGFYKAFFGKFLFDNDCEAWVHGPVYTKI